MKWELGLRCIDLTQFQEGNQAPKLSGGGGLSRVVEEKHYYIIVVAVVVGDVVVLWWCVIVYVVWRSIHDIHNNLLP